MLTENVSIFHRSNIIFLLKLFKGRGKGVSLSLPVPHFLLGKSAIELDTKLGRQNYCSWIKNVCEAEACLFSKKYPTVSFLCTSLKEIISSEMQLVATRHTSQLMRCSDAFLRESLLYCWWITLVTFDLSNNFKIEEIWKHYFFQTSFFSPCNFPIYPGFTSFLHYSHQFQYHISNVRATRS